MRQQFKNLDTWRGKLNATCACLAPPTAMVAVFVIGGVTSNTFIVDAHALAAPRQDAVFDDLANNVPSEPGVDGSLPTQEKSTVQVPITGTTNGTVPTIPGVPGITGDASGIPGTVLAAYQKAANGLAVAMPGCHLTWPLLAGIGKVESAHASGGKVDANGNTRGKILGPVLNGAPGMAAIADTDQGVYDGNTSWDRAVGPMQFIPGTWKVYGADGNGDGVKDPHNVFDAARAAGDYLCAGGADLSSPQGLVQAVLRYNHSMEYVSTVLRWMQTYSTGAVTIPDTQGIITPPTDDTGNVDETNNPTRPGATTTTTPTTPTPTVLPTTPTGSTTPPPTTPPTKPGTTTPTSPKPPYKPSPTPTKSTTTPTTTPPPTTPTSPTTTPPTNNPDTPTPTPDPTPTPTPDPTTPTPDPTCTPDPTATPTPAPTETPAPCATTPAPNGEQTSPAAAQTSGS